MATTNDKQVIFSLVNVGKVYPPKKQVLREIYLGFLLRCEDRRVGSQRIGQEFAAQDHRRDRSELHGRDYPLEGLQRRSAGTGTAARSGQDGEGSGRRGQRKNSSRMLHEYEAVSNKMGEAAPDELEKLLDKQAQLQEKIEAANGWELENVLDLAMDALRCPPRGSKVGSAVRRREAPGGALPPHDPGAGYPVARRADEPSRCRIRAMARAASSAVQGHGHRRDPRPLLPRQRGRMDFGIGSRPWHSVPGELHVLVGAEEGSAGKRREGGVEAPARRWSMSWNGSACRRRPASRRARRG